MEANCEILTRKPWRSVDEEEPILDRLLTLREVTVLTSLSKTTLYRKINAGSFPAPRKISTNRVAWSALAIRKWRRDCSAVPSSQPEVGAT